MSDKTGDIVAGPLRKMRTHLSDSKLAEYYLPIADQILPLNSLLGKTISLTMQGAIECVHCGRRMKKSFNQGYCYPCFTKLAQCDQCIMKPELCHYHAGTCREPEWGEQFCMTDHIVYLANSSGVKVGITRTSQVPTRWIDQGAVQALPVFRVTTRLLSGVMEDLFRQQMSDRTNWRVMLKGQVTPVNLSEVRNQLFEQFHHSIVQLQQAHGLQAIQPLEQAEEVVIDYPVKVYPVKITSFNFDKQAEASGKLQGIKGQYLIFDTGVINIRKFTGYHVSVEIRK